MRLSFRFIFLLAVAGIFSFCSTHKPKKSIADLRTAFNYESGSAEKYNKFAETAMKEGYDTLAQLFMACAKSENIHAANHAKVIENLGEDIGITETAIFEVKSTTENLKAAIKSEIYQMQTIYPGFIRDAENEKAPEAARSFTWAWDSEKKHLKYYRMASSVISGGNENNLPLNWLVCPNCGNTFSPADLKDRCDFCLAKQERFIGYQPKQE